MTPLSDALASLGALAGATLRVWRLDNSRWLLAAGASAGNGAAEFARADTTSWLALGVGSNLFLEVVPLAGRNRDDIVRHLVPIIEQMVDAQLTTAVLSAEIAARFEEIDLLYTIGELLGRPNTVNQVAAVILREVTTVVGARRAGLRVYDETRRVLKSVATLGTDDGAVPDEVSVDDVDALVSEAFRRGEIQTGTQPGWVPGAVLAVPIIYSVGGTPGRVVGTLALADRSGGGGFTRAETKLVRAVAMQIGAALENARLTVGDRERQRMQQEMSLAHDLQLRLMPTPSVLRGDADVAVRSEPAESIGGDFYTFARLGRGRVGIMLGDVASHGLSAALIAAEVLAAAGIHANSTTPPDETLTLLRDSLADELEKTEMYLTVFYGILDPTAGRLVYSSAGHPHAYRIPKTGAPERLDPTAPPLGLVESGRYHRRMLPWQFGDDLLVLFTDGIADHANEQGERFGEPRLIGRIAEHRSGTPDDITRIVFEELAGFGGHQVDDRTLLVLRM